MAVIDHRNKTLLQEGEPFVVRNYRIRAYPSPQLQQHLVKVFGCSRFVYNRLLANTQQSYQDHVADPAVAPKPDISPYGLSKQLTTLKADPSYQWLYEISKGPLQETIFNLGNSFKNFFAKRAKYPRFKRRSHEQSVYYPSGCFTITDGQLTLAKTDSPIRLRGTKAQVKLPLSTREWECTVCHSHHDRDVNAALNLEQLGTKVLLLAKQGLIPEGKQIYLSSDCGTLVH